MTTDRAPSRTVPRDDRDSAEERRARAVESGLDVRLREHERCPTFDVRNPVRSTRYVVVAPALPAREAAMCTCTDFARRAIGTCKHIEAVWLWLEEHPGERPTPPYPGPAVRWSDIDRAVIAMESDAPVVPRSIWARRPGGLLIGSP